MNAIYKSVLFFTIMVVGQSCRNPANSADSYSKSDLTGSWGIIRTISNLGIDPIWDETSGTWIGDDTVDYCDTCINTFYIFDATSFSLYLSHNANATPKHALFVADYEVTENQILAAIGTFEISSIDDGVLHLVKSDGYYFLKKYSGEMPPTYWPDWPTDTTYVN